MDELPRSEERKARIEAMRVKVAEKKAQVM